MIRLALRCLKKIPGLTPFLVSLRKKQDYHTLQSLLPQLYPVALEQGLVRIGPSGDGGYLIPNDLEGMTACFSPGVSLISGFEKECAQRDMKVYMIDASVDAPAESHPAFDFEPLFLGGKTHENWTTLSDWITRKGYGDDQHLMLQMDIEGHEYEAISSTDSSVLSQFRIIVIEFHQIHAFNAHRLAAFQKLLKTHVCVHIHPNNCRRTVACRELEIPPVMEFTFLRKDRVKKTGYQTQFPHPLDQDNEPDTASIALPPCWFKSKP